MYENMDYCTELNNVFSNVKVPVSMKNPLRWHDIAWRVNEKLKVDSFRGGKEKEGKRVAKFDRYSGYPRSCLAIWLVNARKA